MGIERQYEPRYFRKRAEEFRAKAANPEHAGPRHSMMQLAQFYKRLAVRAEEVRALNDIRVAD